MTLVSVPTRVEAEGIVVDITEVPQEDEEEDGSREDIEDTVPDHLGGDSDDVTALGARPGDGVDQEEEREVAGAAEIARTEDTSLGEGCVGCLPEEDVPDVEQGSHTEGVVTPLVVAVDERANQTSHDEDDGHEQRGDDLGERNTSGEQELEKQEREVDEPLDVPHIPDLTRRRSGVTELDIDGCSTEIRGHREVRNAGRSQNDNGDLVEQPRTAGSPEVKEDRDEEGSGEDTERCPQPVGAMGREMEYCVGGVVAQCVVAHDGWSVDEVE